MGFRGQWICSLGLGFLLLFSGGARAETLRVGQYRLGDCQVEVIRDYRPGLFEIDVRNGAGYLNLVVDPAHHTVTRGPNLCGQYGHPAATVRYSEAGGQASYEASCGGFWKSVKGESKVRFNLSTGELDFASVKFQVARFGLPNGLHSGPFKVTRSNFECRRDVFGASGSTSVARQAVPTH